MCSFCYEIELEHSFFVDVALDSSLALERQRRWRAERTIQITMDVDIEDGGIKIERHRFGIGVYHSRHTTTAAHGDTCTPRRANTDQTRQTGRVI